MRCSDRIRTPCWCRACGRGAAGAGHAAGAQLVVEPAWPPSTNASPAAESAPVADCLPRHPDFQLLLPEALDAACREALGLPPKKPSSPNRQGQAQPRDQVDAVRQLLGSPSATSARGRAKVVVIFPAEALNAVAAMPCSRRWKSPPACCDLRWPRTTRRLAAPIRSRCQSLSLPLPPADAAEAWLAGEGSSPRCSRPPGCWRANGTRPACVLAWASLPSAWRAAEPPRWPTGRPARHRCAQRLCHDLLRRSLAAGRYFDTPLRCRPAAASSLLAWATICAARPVTPSIRSTPGC